MPVINPKIGDIIYYTMRPESDGGAQRVMSWCRVLEITQFVGSTCLWGVWFDTLEEVLAFTDTTIPTRDQRYQDALYRQYGYMHADDEITHLYQRGDGKPFSRLTFTRKGITQFWETHDI